jgi:hypothetical protein
MAEYHVKCKEPEARVRSESGVPIPHEMLDPLMESEVLSAGKRELGFSCGEQSGECHGEEAFSRIFRQRRAKCGPRKRELIGSCKACIAHVVTNRFEFGWSGYKTRSE